MGSSSAKTGFWFVLKTEASSGRTKFTVADGTERRMDSLMGLGTKNRQQQNAADCTAYLRERHGDRRALVEEFIAEIEGSAADVSRWQQFCDVRRIRAEMLERVEAAFQAWLAGG